MLKPGDRFGDYTVVRLLGKGGMGSVFLLETAEGAQVAAKILNPETAGNHRARKRFVREAELALGMKHPNLVETYDVGEDPDTGLCYILMEYVSGGSLANRLRHGPLPIDEAIRIVYQIASVLEQARQKGIVHRDIKPANIMFGADGKAKLADLGIARGGLGGTDTTTVTRAGMMIGTPAYMAPEQMIDAHHVDSRADIYSLGIVFYEMLAGQRPYPNDTVVQLMAKAVAGEPVPDVRRLRPDVPASVAKLVGRMCAMSAARRLSTPDEVKKMISRIARSPSEGYGRLYRRVVDWLSVGRRWIWPTALLLLVLGLLPFLKSGNGNPSVRRPSAVEPKPSPAVANAPSPAVTIALPPVKRSIPEPMRICPPKAAGERPAATNAVRRAAPVVEPPAQPAPVVPAVRMMTNAGERVVRPVPEKPRLKKDAPPSRKKPKQKVLPLPTQKPAETPLWALYDQIQKENRAVRRKQTNVQTLEGKSFPLAEGQTLEMSGCPAGRFTMGYGHFPKSGVAAVHDVRITRPFWIGRHPVTKGQWEALKGRDRMSIGSGGSDDSKRPVVGISRDDAQDYCRELTRRLGVNSPTGYVFRLPTDAEWEYALRGGVSDVSDPHVAGHVPEAEWMPSDAPVVVCTKKPNGWGLCDMLGNVDEFVLDLFPEKLSGGGVRKPGTVADDFCYQDQECDLLRMVVRKDRANVFGMVRAKGRLPDAGCRSYVLADKPCPFAGFRIVFGPNLEREQKLSEAVRR